MNFLLLLFVFIGALVCDVFAALKLDECPKLKANLQGRKNVKLDKNVLSWEACAKLCEQDEDCNYWIWHHAGSGYWKFRCNRVESFSGIGKDKNTISGKKDCQETPNGKETKKANKADGKETKKANKADGTPTTTTDYEVTAEQKKKIVETHNNYRSNVSPPATNMQKMVWDDKLAETAKDLALQCIAKHDDNSVRKAAVGWGIGIGQNLAMGQKNMKWEDAVGLWHSEVKFFVFGVGSNTEGESVGHYTAVVQSKSAKVGCGMAYCPKHKWNFQYLCNYAFSQYDFTNPYLEGTKSCTDCPKNCENNLCNCNGKTCINGGTIDIATCGCTCPDGYTGSSCETVKCPGVTCLNGGDTDYKTCECKCSGLYIGSRCETKNCPDKDPSYCGKEQPYGYPKDYCKFSSVQTECPYMCGLC